ncbi:MAG: divalent cation tolerance protein CutA [Candidatus Liptonbacteria bacterium]
MVFIYTTCLDQETAEGICQAIMDRRLAFSVHVTPVDSLHLTAEGFEKRPEYSILIKTNESKMQDIEDEITARSTDPNPFIGVVDIRRLNHDYKERVTHLIQ